MLIRYYFLVIKEIKINVFFNTLDLRQLSYNFLSNKN